MAEIATFDFHVTSECSQECAYCWGPMEIPAVDTDTALAIVSKISSGGARRIVFTGGDPLQRADIGTLVDHAAEQGLEVAVSTTGDKLTSRFLADHGANIDLISLPLDGSTEAVSIRTKKEGHFVAVMRALDLLESRPGIDVKVATPVTRYNIDDVPDIARLLDGRALRLPDRLFYNVFQAFPRSMDPDVAWSELIIDDAEFENLRKRVEAIPHTYPINWLGHETLDKLYAMVFPDGTFTVPAGPAFRNYGPFLEIEDLDALLRQTDFDAPKHQRHAEGWIRTDNEAPASPAE